MPQAPQAASGCLRHLHLEHVAQDVLHRNCLEAASLATLAVLTLGLWALGDWEASLGRPEGTPGEQSTSASCSNGGRVSAGSSTTERPQTETYAGSGMHYGSTVHRWTYEAACRMLMSSAWVLTWQCTSAYAWI